ncbi:MAG: hypothetical protein M3Q81_01600 [bacterium]|nr:hypothetical protein [bacterium]
MQKLNLNDESIVVPSNDVMPQTEIPDLQSSYQKGPNPMSRSRKKSKAVMFIGAVAIAAGVLTGAGAYRLNAGADSSLVSGPPAPMQKVATGEVSTGDVFGIQDEKTFKDSAEGYLAAGGIEGEGSHRLVRPGGVSQTVYLTSSVTDLAKFEGMEVKIWGETFKGQKAGWLMDVGRVQIVNPSGEEPSEE